jgi:hypothetical protein
MKSIAIIAFLLGSFVTHAFAWDGIDSSTGESVEIEKGNLVRSGNDIELYDYETGNYHDVTVENINRYGSTVEIEVYDNATGDTRTLEFED